MAQSEAYSTVETWWKQCQEYSSQSNDALFTLFEKGFETILVVLSKTSDTFCIERSIASLDYERKMALECECKDFNILRHLSFGLIESLQVLLEAKGKINGERNQTLVDQAPYSSPIGVPKEELIDPLQSILDGQQNPALDFAGNSLFKEEDISFEFGVNDTTLTVGKSSNKLSPKDSHGNAPNPSFKIVEPKEEPIDPDDQILEGGNQLPIVDEFMGQSLFKEEEMDFNSSETRRLEKKLRPSRTSSRPARYTECFEESEPVEKKPKIKSEKIIDNKRKSDNVESSPTPSKRRILVSKINHTELECPNCENPALDDFTGESLVKEEDIDIEFGVNHTTFPVGKSENEFSPKDSHGNALNPSLTIVEPKEELIDPIDQILEGNQVPMVDDFMEELLFKEEEMDFNLGVNNAALPIENPLNELPSNDQDSHANDYSETGKAKKKVRPTRTSSRPVRYTESFDETEPVEKKPRIKSEKKIDINRRSDVDDSSQPSSEVVRIKINHTELQCPNCEYRSRSVNAWMLHLKRVHSTYPRELGLALLCECGDESFTDQHSRKCEISKITVVYKNVTPQCVTCEVYPKTAFGYARHLESHHKTTLKKMGIFLICSCGCKFRSHHVDPEHTKKCNGHEYTLHKLDEE